MSATFFNGYNEQKPSSRVLNPPGGKSNNIFAGVDDNDANKHEQPNAQKADLTPKQEAQNNKNRNQNGSNIFGGGGGGGGGGYEEPMNKQEQQQQLRAERSQAVKEQYQQNRQSVQSAKKRAGYNPITGEEY